MSKVWRNEVAMSWPHFLFSIQSLPVMSQENTPPKIWDNLKTNEQGEPARVTNEPGEFEK